MNRTESKRVRTVREAEAKNRGQTLTESDYHANFEHEDWTIIEDTPTIKRRKKGFLAPLEQPYVREPFRLRTTLPKKLQEGGRDFYPTITLNDPEANKIADFPDNALYTTKYTLFTYIPRILYEQFRKATSIYFLLICIISWIPGVSPFNPLTSMSGLVFIVGMAAIREAYEDILRLRADIKVNSEKFTVVEPNTGDLILTKSMQIQVGDLVYLQNNERVPIDCYLLASDNEDGVAFIETAQLDGETNLKQRRPPKHTAEMELKELSKIRGEVDAETPNQQLYSFKGSLSVNGTDDPISLDQKGLLLMSSVLRNTKWAVGVSLYAGPETKVGLNQKQPPSKFSQLDKKLNKYVLIIFAFKMCLCVFLTGMFLYHETGPFVTHFDLRGSLLTEGIKIFLSYFALLSYFIPLSLVVTLEMVRFAQAAFIQWDDKFKYDGKTCVAKTSNLNDELALIDYVFSDKTGTLTQNEMRFVQASVRGEIYDDTNGDGILGQEIKKNNSQSKYVEEFVRLMAICHSVVPDTDENGELIYKAPSPDEEALCNGAKQNGLTFTGRKQGNIVVNTFGTEEKYELLCEMEFTSQRRRMSVIVRDSSGAIKLYTKGADSMIASRLAKTDDNKSLLLSTNRDLDYFSTRGLRTLLVGYKDLTEDEWKAFWKKYNEANNVLEDRDKAVEDVCDKMEKNIVLLGATAIEDRLQDGVPQAIADLRHAGIKVWVITGDKQATAINIGYSSNLITKDMKLIKVNAKSSEECYRLLHDINTKRKFDVADDDSLYEGASAYDDQLALVVDGNTLRFILSDHREEFLKLATKCVSVLCNRVTPLQKAEVVRLVKDECHKVTLSIGDGGNDVPMIQAADLGIGIQGREGSQAARASDFSIAQFAHLVRLLTVHGRYSLLRNTKVIYYSFYKNAAVFLAQFWFSFFSGYSATTLYDDWVMSFYNILFTFVPVFVLGMFEKDLLEHIIIKNPPVYKYHKHLKWTSLLTWLVYALWHSIVIFGIPTLLFQNTTLLQSGHPMGLNVYGAFIMTFGILVVTIKIFFETSHMTILNHIAYWGSIVFYVAFILLESQFPLYVPRMFKVSDTLFQIPSLYLTCVLGLVLCLNPDLMFKYLNRQLHPKSWYILQEMGRYGKSDDSHALKRTTAGSDKKRSLLSHQYSLPEEDGVNSDDDVTSTGSLSTPNLRDDEEESILIVQ